MDYARMTLTGLAIFLFGIIFGHTIATTASTLTGAATDTPQSIGTVSDLPMPRDRISEEQIIVTDRGVTLAIQDASWSRFTGTKSMIPFLDTGANAIQVEPRYPQELQIGDIISYEVGGISIIHRIVDIGYDNQGWYAVAKGDNNPISDPIKIRFDQIDRVLVAIIY